LRYWGFNSGPQHSGSVFQLSYCKRSGFFLCSI
jgi:hypothetical protein